MTPDSSFAIISFDLQGTLSDSAFSDEFWLTQLPLLYAERYGITVDAAKSHLKEQFRRYGKYHERYYCARSWLAELCPGRTVADVARDLVNSPRLFGDTMELVRELSVAPVPLIILSTTTHDFIELELKGAELSFRQIYSTLDNFGLAGKPAAAFQEVAKRMGVPVNQILHIGDCPEMDIKNAQAAGCQTFYFDKSQPRDKLVSKLRSLLDGTAPG